MRASTFEFRYRFWIFGALFWLAFSCYSFDPINAGGALLHWIRPSLLKDTQAELVGLHIIFFVGALFSTANAALRTWATAYLKTERVHDSNLRSESLVADGPYRYVRNPLYLGTTLLGIGMGLLASRLGFVILIFGMILFHCRLILREEFELKLTQGESYRAYLKAVPRLFPSLTPQVPSAGSSPQWGQAFIGESFMWIFAVGEMIFAATVSGKWMGVTTISALVIYFLAIFYVRRSAAT